MSFLDMMTNFTGAVIILFLLASKFQGDIPYKNVRGVATVDFNQFNNKITGQLDPTKLILDSIKPGDTLLVVVGKTMNVAEKKEIASNTTTNTNSSGVRLQDDEIIVNREDYEKKVDPVAPGACRLVPRLIGTLACNDNGTPKNPDDDTYTAEVNVELIGTCQGSSLWKDDLGTTLSYNKPKKYTFKTKDPSKTIQFFDYNNKDLKGSLIIPAPKPCSSASAGNTEKPEFNPPNGVNFVIEFDEESGNKVNLYVEKNGEWVCGRKDGKSRSNPNIGDWTNEKTNVTWLVRTKSGVEKVVQKQPIPGTYKIYAHFKGTPKDNPVNSVPVKLAVSSRQGNQGKVFSARNVPFTKEPPPNGGGLLLKTVTVLPDGKLKFQ
jgi:hypothetical protein